MPFPISIGHLYLAGIKGSEAHSCCLHSHLFLCLVQCIKRVRPCQAQGAKLSGNHVTPDSRGPDSQKAHVGGRDKQETDKN